MNGYVNMFQVSTFALNTPFCLGHLVSWLLALCANAFLPPNSCFVLFFFLGAMCSSHLIFLLGVYQIFLETPIISLIAFFPHTCQLRDFLEVLSSSLVYVILHVLCFPILHLHVFTQIRWLYIILTCRDNNG
jgi:hypothetical protein